MACRRKKFKIQQIPGILTFVSHFSAWCETRYNLSMRFYGKLGSIRVSEEKCLQIVKNDCDCCFEIAN